MNTFLSDDFMLNTASAKKLYHEYCEEMPIFDYHCHINPKDIAEDRIYSNITQLWLGGDHYKWRQMRSNGIDEYYITGGASDRDKFQKWAETLEKAIGNPLYHWSHLELQRYFGYSGVLNTRTAETVWELCNDRLKEMSVRNIIMKSRVRFICTTDDPIDSLEWHKIIASDSTFDVQVLPTWRPDKAMNIDMTNYLEYISMLSTVSQVNITDFQSFKASLKVRMDYFKAHGCIVSDHGLEYVMYNPASEEEVSRIFLKRLNGYSVTREEELIFKTAFMQFMGREVHRYNWVMQLHYGCKRDNNETAYKKLGPDTGFDCINNHTPTAQLAYFLNSLACTNQLPKSIIYSLNPNDNAAIDTIIGCFQSSDTVGKIQHGAAWWFNDHKVGMMEQLISLANLGLLGNFIGMLTDSRSFLSYVRHEYFRRILCDVVGKWIEDGELPAQFSEIGQIMKDISYNNVVRYFNLM